MEHMNCAGNVDIVSPSSQINSQAIEWKGSVPSVYVITYSFVAFDETVRPIASRRQVREVTERGSRDGSADDNAVDAVDGDVVEDIAVMDYAQPHRKPPIHNEKP
ncbi:hypothetical protein CRG98_038085 [Punica granatum]|uniref:Uncharacterized protein n=1 Tax=Punica granatum TaxID=22663 RepID=A0A2I0IC62_PUNGR|nr:hypothetical protein CRG98_038085 [Punica granatum]